mgnify:FL=1
MDSFTPVVHYPVTLLLITYGSGIRDFASKVVVSPARIGTIYGLERYIKTGCGGPAKVCAHACRAIDWTMPVVVGIFTAQILQDAHLTDIGAQRKHSTP